MDEHDGEKNDKGTETKRKPAFEHTEQRQKDNRTQNQLQTSRAAELMIMIMI